MTVRSILCIVGIILKCHSLPYLVLFDLCSTLSGTAMITLLSLGLYLPDKSLLILLFSILLCHIVSNFAFQDTMFYYVILSDSFSFFTFPFIFPKGNTFLGFQWVFLYHKIVYTQYYLDCTQIVYFINVYQFIPQPFMLSHTNPPTGWVAALCALSWSVKSTG